jgi:hypothetical protein
LVRPGDLHPTQQVRVDLPGSAVVVRRRR